MDKLCNRHINNQCNSGAQIRPRRVKMRFRSLLAGGRGLMCDGLGLGQAREQAGGIRVQPEGTCIGL